MSQLPRQIQEFIARMDCNDLETTLEQLKSQAYRSWKEDNSEGLDWKNIYLALEKAHRLVAQRST